MQVDGIFIHIQTQLSSCQRFNYRAVEILSTCAYGKFAESATVIYQLIATATIIFSKQNGAATK